LPPGFASSATVTVPAHPGDVFPCASCAVPCTAGVIAAPAVVLLGCTLNTSWLAVPAAILKPALVREVTPEPVALSVYPVPTLLILRLANVATPFTAATLVVPESVPPPGFASSATVTVPVNPVAVFPSASSAVTCTAGVIVAPAVVLLGSTVNTTWAAAVMLAPAAVDDGSTVKASCETAAGEMVKPVDVVSVTPFAAALSV